MKYFISPIVLVLVACSLPAEEIYEGAGSSGMVFLKIGVGPRGSGLAGAYSAVADNSMAVFWNPAGLAGIKGTDMAFAHNEYVEGMRYDVASLAMDTKIGSFGLGMGALYADDLELREKPGPPQGLFRYYDYILSLSYARKMSSETDVGFTAKALQERIYIYSATGFAFDFGVAFRPKDLRGLTFTGTLLNFGPKVKFREEGFKLPLIYRVGGAYTVPWQFLEGNWLLSFEGSKSIDADYVYCGGMEYTFRNALALRGGYKYGHDTESFSFGAGFTFANMRLNYSYTPWSYDNESFGAEHWISVGASLD